MNATNEHITVGSNCLADFLGHKNPEAVVSLMEHLFDAFAAAEDEEGGWGGGGGTPTHVSLGTFLGFVASSIRRDGWLSRTAARNANRASTATADLAMNDLFRMAEGKLPQSEQPTAEDYKRGREALDFMRNFVETAPTNDYLHNLSVVIRVGSVGYKTAGLAASIVTTAEKEQNREIQRRKFLNLSKTSKFQGEVGAKIQVKVTVLSVQELESIYGVTTLVKFLTEDESLLTWFASGSKRDEWNREDTFTLAATIKKTEEFKGVKQTVLTRCVAMTEEAVRLEAEKLAKKQAREARKAAKANA